MKAQITLPTSSRTAIIFPSPTNPIPLPSFLNRRSRMKRMKWKRGILIDSVFSYISTFGLAQFHAYCRGNHVDPNMDTSRKAQFVFANRRHSSSGTSTVIVPLNHQWLACKFHVLPIYLPLFLSIQDMNCLVIMYYNRSDKVIHKYSSNYAPITQQWVHALMTWPTAHQCNFTEQELRNMHWRFGNQSVRKLAILIKRATGKLAKKSTLEMLRSIWQHCHYCEKYRTKPQILKLILRDSSILLNHFVYRDIL